MKKIVVILIMLCVTLTYAQTEKPTKSVKKADLTEVTYFDSKGNIQQIGTFNAKGKLHGEWVSFDTNGKKTSVGNYNNGKKVGKWFFWSSDILKEVDYLNSKVVKVSQWDNKSNVVVRNK